MPGFSPVHHWAGSQLCLEPDPPTGYSSQPTTTIQWPHAAHTGDTPRAYSPVTERSLLLGLIGSLYKVISPRSGNLNNLPNNRNKQRIRQNKKTEEYVLNKEQDKTSEKELNGGEISNLPNKESQVKIKTNLNKLKRFNHIKHLF